MADVPNTLLVPSDIDLAQAQAEKTRLLDFLDTWAGGELSIDLDQDACTQPSLQLYYAALKEAAARDIPVSSSNDKATRLAEVLAETGKAST